MRITACYIVKNEAAVFARSLESIQGQVDEIVVVDTGSNDETIRIAQRYGARVVAHAWQEDFSEARNFALAQLQTDWVVFLDADEYFTLETAAHLRTVIERNQNASGLLIKRLDVDADKNNEILASLFVLRIFPLRAELRFSGRIHEELREAGQDLVRPAFVPAEELLLMHTGYSASVNREKAERNLALLLQELKETAAPGRLYGYLADAYFGLDDTEQAMRYARLDIAQGRRPVTYASRSYRILMQILAANRVLYRERLALARQAVKDFPELPEFHAEYAESLAYAFAYEAALAEGKKAIAAAAVPEGIEQHFFTDRSAALLQERMEHWRRIQARLQTIRITAAVIVKNEAAEIGRWITNARVYSDEIVFVDTGSTDATREIAQQAGVKVLDYAWKDDFSAARNFLIDASHGDWIVSPDADEYFDHPENIRAFLAEIDLEQPETDIVMVTSSNIDADDHDREINRYPVGRIFRRRKDLRYVGNVHECLATPRGELKYFMEPARFLLWHTGYSTQRIRQKTKRDLALLLADIRKNGEGPQHYSYLADCYRTLGQYEKSLHYIELAIAAPQKGVGVGSDLYRQGLDDLHHLQRPLTEQLTFAQTAVAQYPLLPDFHAAEGALLCALHRLAEGKLALERARNLFETPQDTSGELTSALRIMDGVYCRLGRLYAAGGEVELAEGQLYKALQLNKYNHEALSVYAALQCQPLVPESFAASLSAIYHEDAADGAYLRQWAEQNGYVQLYRYYAQRISENGLAGQDGLAAFYDLALQKQFPALTARVLQRAGELLPQLFFSLLCLLDKAEEQELAARSREILPVALRHVLERYKDAAFPLENADFDGYSSMLDIVADFATTEQLERYVQLAADFSVEQLYQVAKHLYDKQHWAAAMQLYQAVPADAPVVTADFWHDVGICLFQLQQPAAAQECLGRAREMGCSQPDITSYLTWIGRAVQHD